MAVGAFAANVTTDVGVAGAAAIAAGNTLEAVAAAWLLARAGMDDRLERVSDVLRLVALAALASTAVAATVGATTLWATKAVSLAGVPRAWFLWWTGDMLGDLVVAPALLTWSAGGSLRARHRGAVELVPFGVVLFGVCGLVFFAVWPGQRGYGWSYALFPALAWAALRFGTRGASAASFVVSIFAIVATARGSGPFVGGGLTDSLLSAGTYLLVVALTSLLLAAAAAERDRAIDAREDFISVASHELRTPLTPLKLTIDSLRRGGRADANVAGALERADRQVVRLTRLVDQLLDVTRLRTARVEVEREADVDLVALVREVVDAHAAELARSGSQLVVDAPAPVRGAWDRSRMQQVVANLLINAAKYGEGRPIEVSVSRAGTDALVVVADQGPGIPPNEQRRIFERFERASSSRRVGGLGLGLYIARGVVRAHGGDIVVESAPGQGAKFIVRVPVD